MLDGLGKRGLVDPQQHTNGLLHQSLRVDCGLPDNPSFTSARAGVLPTALSGEALHAHLGMTPFAISPQLTQTLRTRSRVRSAWLK
jgi:hypothetical protein